MLNSGFFVFHQRSRNNVRFGLVLSSILVRAVDVDATHSALLHSAPLDRHRDPVRDRGIWSAPASIIPSVMADGQKQLQALSDEYQKLQSGMRSHE